LRFLIRFGIQNKWLQHFYGDIFSSAVHMDCFDIVDDILDPDVAEPPVSHLYWRKVILDAILVACEKGKESIARLIMGRFVINNAVYVRGRDTRIQVGRGSSWSLSWSGDYGTSKKISAKQRWVYSFRREQKSTKCYLQGFSMPH
jgi:hypothetical protein